MAESEPRIATESEKVRLLLEQTARLRDRIAELEEALEPLCIEIGPQLDDRVMFPVYVRAGDARKARAVLPQPKDEGTGEDAADLSLARKARWGLKDDGAGVAP